MNQHQLDKSTSNKQNCSGTIFFDTMFLVLIASVVKMFLWWVVGYYSDTFTKEHVVPLPKGVLSSPAESSPWWKRFQARIQHDTYGC